MSWYALVYWPHIAPCRIKSDVGMLYLVTYVQVAFQVIHIIPQHSSTCSQFR